ISLAKLIDNYEFRQDLLYRINTVEINLPPLRERQEDIPALIDYYLQKYAHKYHKNVRGISANTLSKLQKYAWPGNIRELQHAVERAVIMADQEMLHPEDFNFNMQTFTASGLHFDKYNLETVEKVIIQKAMQKHKGNITHAADELGLTRAALYRRLEKHNL
ncbi:MAG: sigma-54-dependent Fis family transcriptional regulator, partial [Calditrichaeota bacterium]